MDWLTIGSDIGTMATGLSAVTAAYVWTRNQVRGWRQEKAEKQIKNWHGFIPLGQVDTWRVRLVEEPKSPTARVVLEAVNPDGSPDEMIAHVIRERIKQDGFLSRSPTTEEFEFLKELQRKRGYGKGVVIR